MRLSLFLRPSLQVRITGLVTMVVLLVLFIVGLSFSKIVTHLVEQEIGNSALETARMVAEMSVIREAIKTSHPPSILQPMMEEFKKKTNTKFIVILNNKGIRFTHANPQEIGKPFTGGDEGPALKGKSYISKAVGISGPSIRAFTPIIDPITHEQLGVVVVGMFERNFSEIIKSYTSSIILWLLVGLTVGMIGSLLLAKSIKKILHGLEPDQIARLFKEREAMLECLGEGVIAIDREARITLVNQSARSMLSINENPVGKKISEVIENSSLPRVIDSEEKEKDLELSVNNIHLLTNRSPIKVNGNTVGVIAVFRDMTEIRNLAEELTGVRQYVEGLRAKTHEFMNRLQALSGLLELGEYEEAKQYITSTTSKQQKFLQFLNRRIRDPKTSGLLLGKIQQAEELNIHISIDPASYLHELPDKDISDTLVLTLGNLLENAMDALKSRMGGEIVVSFIENEKELLLNVEDDGPGIPPEILPFIFNKGFSTKGSERGYGLHLVKKQVEQVTKGRLSVTSAEGEGTCFSVRIPINKKIDNQAI